MRVENVFPRFDALFRVRDAGFPASSPRGPAARIFENAAAISKGQPFQLMNELMKHLG